jgi:fumarylacetoacetase
LEVSTDGTSPAVLASGRHLGYLQDGDEIEVRAWAVDPSGRRIDFGSAAARVMPALDEGESA